MLGESILPEVFPNEAIEFSCLTKNRDGPSECAHERTENDGARRQPIP